MIRLVTKSRSPAFMLALLALFTTVASLVLWWQRHDFGLHAFRFGLPTTPALLLLLLPCTVAIFLTEKKTPSVRAAAVCIAMLLLCDIAIGGSWILDHSPLLGYPVFIVEGSTDNWFPSVNAAFALIALTLLGIGTLALCFHKSYRYTAPLAWTCGIIVLLGAPIATAILSFHFGQFEPFPYQDPLAYLVTGSVVLCGAALMFARPSRTVTTEASVRLRAAVIVLVTGCTFALWYGMTAVEIRQLESEVDTKLSIVKETLLIGVEDKAAATTRLVEHWKNLQWQFNETLFLNDSRLFLRDLPATYAIAVTDASGSILYAARRQQPFDADPTIHDTIILSNTLENELAALGQPLTTLATQALQLKRGQNGRPIALDKDRTLSVLAQPQFIDDVGVGCVILLVRTDQGLRKTLGSVALDYTVELGFNNSVDYVRAAHDGESPLSKHFARTIKFTLRNTDYALTVRPGNHVVNHSLTWQPRGALIVSWCVLFFLSFALYSEKRAQTLLLDRERLLNESLDIIGTLDANGRYLSINEAAHRILGFTALNLRGQLFTDLVHADDVPIVHEHWNNAVGGIRRPLPTIRFKRNDGEIVYMQGNTHWVPAQQWFYIDLRDVTEQHSLEVKRRHAENTFSTGVELAGCVVYEYFPDTGEIHWVGAVEALTGYTAEEFSANGLATWTNALHDEDRERATKALRRCLLAGQPHTVDYRLLRKDGRTVPVLDRGRPLIDTDTYSLRIIGVLLDLTSIREQEAALRRSEERYRIIATQVGAVIIERDNKTQRTQVHGPIESILGYSKQATEQQPIDVDDLIHPDDQARVIATKQAAQTALSSYYCEFRYRHRKGHYIHIAMRGIYLPGTDGLAERSVAAITDITERKLTEEKLRESQDRFRAAAEQASQVVYEWVLDQDGKTEAIRIEGACEQLFGYSADDLYRRLSTEPFAMVYPEDLPLLTQNLQLRRGGSDYYLVEHRVPHRDGHIYYVENRGAIYRDSTGKAIHIIGMVLDITSRKRAESAQQQHIEQLRMLSDIARRMGTALSMHDLLQSVSQSMRDLVSAKAAVAFINETGESDDHIAATSIDLNDTANRSKLLNSTPLHGLVYQSRAAVRLSRQHIVGNRDWQPLSIDDERHHPIDGWMGVPLFARNGMVMGLLEVSGKHQGEFTDSDQQILIQLAGLTSAAIENIRLYATLEQRVAARTRELEISNRELEAFSYSVSHDLRAPLRAIAGFSTILEQEYGSKLTGEGRRYVQRIVSGAERMANLIDDLLSLARVSRVDLSRETVDITALSRSIVKRQKERWPDRKLDITIDTRMRATADPRLTEVALENLIENALKFTSTRDEARIHIGRRTVEGKPTFFVCDNGVGFDPQYASNLFGVFQRLHSNNEFPGTGVGLATVHRIVQRHHGRTWAESTLNEGATFYFTLESN